MKIQACLAAYQEKKEGCEMQGNRPFVQKENFLVAKSARLGGFCLFLWTLVACSPTHGLVPLPQATGFYRLGAGDQVRVLTYNDPQLSNTFFVADTGTIAFPLIGIVQAAGETPQSLANELTKTLSSRGLLRDPSVSVEVMKYRPVFILGEVSKPGQYQYIPGMTMQSAVALAGGYTYRAITNTASAVRTEGINGNHPVNGRIIPETLLAPGDVVTIYERYF